MTGDDALRSQYVPPEPTVKILKRPTKESQNTNDSKLYQPKKTLQQREQEYAEARLRILGETEKPEEKYVGLKTTVWGFKMSFFRISIATPSKTKLAENDNVIRMPKGPDGSRGFHMRR